MFCGSLVALVTPMRADGSLDLAAWTRLIDLHLASGTSGLVVGGSTGESVALEDEELHTLARRACEQVRGRAAVIVGAGTSSTSSTVQRVRALSELPIDGLLIVTPAYNRPTQEGLYGHFARIAEAAGKPLLLYNVPSRTAVDLKPATVARLARLPGIVGLKEAVAGMERLRELRQLCPESFVVLSGEDAAAREWVLEGARGVISVTANVVPRAMSEMMAAAAAGDRRRAEQLDEPLAALHRELFVESNPIPVKWALARMGLIEGTIRLPLTTLSAEHEGALLRALRSAGALQAHEG